MRAADSLLPTWSTDPGAGAAFTEDRARGALNAPLYASPRMVIDRFRVRPDHDMWCGVSVARSHMIVFARRAVEIEQAARRRLVASPVIATLYNRGQEYRRTPIEDEDLNEAFHFAPGLVRDAIAAFDPSVLDREDVFAHGSFPVSASTYLLQRRVVLYAARGPHADPLRVEEGALQVLERSLADAHDAWSQHRRRGVSPSTPSGQREAVRQALRIITAAPERRMTLDELSDAVELSPFHLCRVFRAHVGMTIGEFVHRERLRRSLGELERASIDLTEVALKYGYASHSHFTSRFGREFNATPSTIRRALSRGGLPADAIL